jgi:hypothetical protein
VTRCFCPDRVNIRSVIIQAATGGDGSCYNTVAEALIARLLYSDYCLHARIQVEAQTECPPYHLQTFF